MRRKLLLFITFCVSSFAIAQAPAGYYDAANGKSGQALRTALEGIIGNPGVKSYDAAWDAYYTTDVRADGKIWDMYSNITNYTPGKNQNTGSAKKEGDNYNREHSFPKSWFGDKNATTVMGRDLYHLVPTDSYINSMRSNNPYGEVSSITYSSSGNFSKQGTATSELVADGYNGTDKVFEPNDQYKGDFARNYFYMLTCYASKVTSWPGESSGRMFNNGDFLPWAINMLLRWSKNDPVSDKERNRTNAVYKIQGNRNPFIDCPGLEEYIWGDKKNTPVNMGTLSGIISVPAEHANNMRVTVDNGALSIDVFNDNSHINIYDLSGRAVVSAVVNKGNYRYNLQKGIYLIAKKKVVVN